MKTSDRAMCKWRGCFIGILLISLVLLMTPGKSSAATINIDASKTISANPLILGNNMEVGAGWNNTEATGWGAWDPCGTSAATSTSVQAVVDFAVNAGLNTLRFPGGSIANQYHWLNGIGPYADRPLTKYLGWDDSDNYYGTDEHMTFCEDAGVQAMITTNVVSGTAKEAAAWVAYLNGEVGDTTVIGVDENGDDWYDVDYWATLRGNPDYANHPAPFNVRYWEVGNEIWHSYTSVVDYAEDFQDFYSAMTAVDPNIEVGAVLDWNYSWINTLLGGIGGEVDFLIIHSYYPFVSTQGDVDEILAKGVEKTFEATLASPFYVQNFNLQVRDWVESSPAAASRAQDIDIAHTEYNTSFYNDLDDTVKNYQYSLGTALHNAGMLNAYMVSNNKVATANNWDFKSNVYGLVKGLDAPYTVRPNYYVYEIYNDYSGPQMVDTMVASATYENEAVTNISAITSYTTDADDAKFRIRLQRDAGKVIGGDVWYDDLVIKESSSETNLLLNPGFESDFTDWVHLADPSGVTSSIDSTVSRGGAKSFKLAFAGDSDPDYDGMYQDVVISPNTSYDITGYSKTQGLNMVPTNMLVNPGFEDDFTGWTRDADPRGATTSIDSTVSHSGTKSAKVVFSRLRGDYSATYQTVDVDPSASIIYALEGYIKTDGITATEGVRLAWEDVRGASYGSGETPEVVKTKDWTYVTTRAKVASDATQIIVRLARAGGGSLSGTAWWDDIQIQPDLRTHTSNIKIDVLNSDDTIDETLEIWGLVGTHDWMPRKTIKTGGTPYLSAVASKDGADYLYLTVINKDLNNDITATINISGFTIPSETSALTLNGPSIDSTNESSNLVKVTSSTVSNASTSFDYTFPAHSLTAIGFGRSAPPPANPTGLTATAGDGQVSLDWADNSETDLAGYNVYRSETQGGPYSQINASLVTTSDYVDSSVTNGTTYYYVVTAVDTSNKESGYSNEASATPQSGSTAPDVANSDYSNTAGDVSGSYLDTHAQDDTYESILEHIEGNRPGNRYDWVDHVWDFTITGNNHIFYIDAFYADGGDADTGFIFQWSTSPNSGFTDMLTVTKTADNDTYQSYDLGTPSGTIYIKVIDTNRTDDNRKPDEIYIDHMYISP